MKVGPQSAGAVPGPACYGRGNTEPTVTDANLLLGRLSARGLLDGGMSLDEGKARAAFEPAARRLGLSVERTAEGVLDIVAANMIRAIRTVSVERGHDPRGYVLAAFGGAGPLHARDVAAGIGIGEILVPSAPGIVCAEGLLVSDLRETFTRSERIAVTAEAFPRIAAILEELEEQARLWLAGEGATEGRQTEVSLDMRHVGQNFELAVALAETGLGILRDRFLDAHEFAYGFRNPEDPVEIVNLRLTAKARLYRAPRDHAAARRRAARAEREPARPLRGTGVPEDAGLRPRLSRSRKPHRRPGRHRAARRHRHRLSGRQRCGGCLRQPHHPDRLHDRSRPHRPRNPRQRAALHNRRDLRRADEERLLHQYQGAARPLDRDHGCEEAV